MSVSDLKHFARVDEAAGLPLSCAERTAREVDDTFGRGSGAVYLAAFRAARNLRVRTLA